VPDETLVAKDFAARYRAGFALDADVHAALAYENLLLLAEAMSRTKDQLTLSRVREELAQMRDFSGLMGPVSFTTERQLRRPAFVVRIEGGNAKLVKRYNPEP
jgi:ABC-type branched-subunit amino acid transport system substrate-binding protein